MLNLEKIKIAIVGIGNCASSLIQGIHYYDGKNPEDAIGLMHWEIGGYKPSDIDVVAAFDVDARKVGKTIDEAIFAKPNCTTVFQEDIPKYDAKECIRKKWLSVAAEEDICYNPGKEQMEGRSVYENAGIIRTVSKSGSCLAGKTLLVLER